MSPLSGDRKSFQPMSGYGRRWVGRCLVSLSFSGIRLPQTSGERRVTSVVPRRGTALQPVHRDHVAGKRHLPSATGNNQASKSRLCSGANLRKSNYNSARKVLPTSVRSGTVSASLRLTRLSAYLSDLVDLPHHAFSWLVGDRGRGGPFLAGIGVLKLPGADPVQCAPPATLSAVKYSLRIPGFSGHGSIT